MKQVDNSMGIYIHIPFCVKKCDYCDFLSGPAVLEEQLLYMEALRRELRMVSEEGAIANTVWSPECGAFSSDKDTSYRDAAEKNTGVGSVTGAGRGQGGKFPRRVDTVFFGGGTPSILPAEEIARTLQTVRSCFDVAEDAEITVECNPGTLTEEKCRVYRACGVNRLSIGLQSADNRLLKNIGRIHTFEEFLDSYGAARRAGFTNINIDLMSGLPGQSVGDHVDTLRRVLELRPEHISAYSLILEEGTMLYQRVVTLPTEDEEMEMYVRTREILEAHGYQRYEISNYSLPGRECRHNLRYWNLLDYLGVGIGAASFVDGCRFKNIDDRGQYVGLLLSEPRRKSAVKSKSERSDRKSTATFESDRSNRESAAALKRDCSNRESDGFPKFEQIKEELRTEFTRETDRELMEEFVFLGLRKLEGIRTAEFADRFGQTFDTVYGSVRDKLTAQGFLKKSADGGALSLTDRGIDFSNEVLAEFLM